MNTHGQTICLGMIVKNEAPVIRRCLESLRPVITHWVVVDTGSTDGTQEVVRQTLRDVPGELFERPWRDFAHNRSEALALARRFGDYTLIIDADDTLELDPGFEMPRLVADSYTVEIADTASRYRRPQLVRNALPWRYEGVLHEFLTCEGAQTQEHLRGIRIRRGHDGARRKDASTYRRDAELLERALQTEQNPFLIARYRFYLAQSYRDCGEPQKALENYLIRAGLGFWQEEVFISLYYAAKLRAQLGHSPDDVVAAFLRAAEAAPARAEALHGASRFCREKGRNEEGYRIAKRGLALTQPGDGLFVEPWIYEYGLLDEFSVNAYWAGHPRESLDAALLALASGRVPHDQRGRFEQNARFALGRLGQTERGDVSPMVAQEAASASAATSPPPEAPLELCPSRLSDPAPTVFVAILAKQKEPVLGLYLDRLEQLDYPKSRMHLYIRTNNNTDGTAALLAEWVDRVGRHYASVEMDASDVPERVQDYQVHEWNATRFKVLAEIREASLRKAVERGCDYYFVADADNFLKPCTLRELVSTGLPIVAPLLTCVDAANPRYSNYHAAIDENGYYKDCPAYHDILERRLVGLIRVPVVHCTYLVRSDVIARLGYRDGSRRHEYVVFSDIARRAGVPQYIDNRQVYGCLTLEDGPAAVRSGILAWALPSAMPGEMPDAAEVIGVASQAGDSEILPSIRRTA